MFHFITNTTTASSSSRCLHERFVSMGDASIIACLVTLREPIIFLNYMIDVYVVRFARSGAGRLKPDRLVLERSENSLNYWLCFTAHTGELFMLIR